MGRVVSQKKGKAYSGVQKSEGKLSSKQRKAAERRAEYDSKLTKDAIRRQRDRWVQHQAYTTDDWRYQHIRMWLEWQRARNYKSTPSAIRDRLDPIFTRPLELDLVWADFESARLVKAEELGKDPEEFFEDGLWFGETPQAPFWHHWKWWSALGRLEQRFRRVFFHAAIIRFDEAGLPVFKEESTEDDELTGTDIPDYDDPEDQSQAQVFTQEWEVLKAVKAPAYAALGKALEEEDELAKALGDIGVQDEDAMDD